MKSSALAGSVVAGDHRVEKPGQLLDESVQLRIKEQLKYVSRGGLKLEHALDQFQLPVTGRVCVDLGASTGGFTDVLLRRGAARVYALDVGRGLLHWRLRQDPRVVVIERVDARDLTEFPELRMGGDFPFEHYYAFGLTTMANARLVTETLVERGYSDEDVLKILGGNFLRLFREVWR